MALVDSWKVNRHQLDGLSVITASTSADLRIGARRGDGGRDWVAQAGIVVLILFERIVLQPRSTVAAYHVVLEALYAAGGEVFGTRRATSLPGLQDAN